MKFHVVNLLQCAIANQQFVANFSSSLHQLTTLKDSPASSPGKQSHLGGSLVITSCDQVTKLSYWQWQIESLTDRVAISGQKWPFLWDEDNVIKGNIKTLLALSKSFPHELYEPAQSSCHIACGSQTFVMIYVAMITGYKFTKQPSWPCSSEKPLQNHGDGWVSII